MRANPVALETTALTTRPKLLNDEKQKMNNATYGIRTHDGRTLWFLRPPPWNHSAKVAREMPVFYH
jgi:hypothetical protein